MPARDNITGDVCPCFDHIGIVRMHTRCMSLQGIRGEDGSNLEALNPVFASRPIATAGYPEEKKLRAGKSAALLAAVLTQTHKTKCPALNPKPPKHSQGRCLGQGRHRSSSRRRGSQGPCGSSTRDSKNSCSRDFV